MDLNHLTSDGEATMNGVNPFDGGSRVFGIPELARLIFGYLNKNDVAHLARLSPLAYNISLEFLWKDLPRLEPLLRVLSPLVESGDKYEFQDVPTESNWMRFKRIAFHIRSLGSERLTHGPRIRSPLQHALSDETLTLLESSRPVHIRHLLPRLHVLHWSGGAEEVNPSSMIPFLPPSLGVMSLVMGSFGSSGVSPNAQFLSDVVKLVDLDRGTLRFEAWSDDYESALVSCLKSLPRLKYLRLRARGMPYRSLELGFFRTLALPKRLKTLDIEMSARNHEDGSNIFRLLARRCPSLSRLSLHIHLSLPVPFDIVNPLLGCHRLHTLNVTARLLMAPAVADIASMTNAWPRLRSLDLRCLSLSLSNISLFATLALTRLTLSVWFDVDNLPDTPPERLFPNLKSLSLKGHLIRLSDANLLKLANYLSHLCAPSTDLSKGPSSRYSGLWERVVASVKAAHAYPDSASPKHIAERTADT